MIYALAFCIGVLLGRWSRRPHPRRSSSAYFIKRKDVWPVMASWRADAVEAMRRK